MKRKAISFLLTLLIVSQSCVAYQKTPDPINKAYNQGMVKVISNMVTKMNFKEIVLEESNAA